MTISSISPPHPINFWQIIRQKLFSPAALVTEVGARRRAELLSGFSFLLALSTAAGSIAGYLVTPGVFRSATVSLLITAVLSLIAYILSRTRYYVGGSALITLALSLTAFLTVIGGTDTVSSSLFSSIPIALIIASALFSVRGLVVTLIANVAGILLLPSLVTYVTARDITSAAGVIGTFGLLLIIIGNVRNAIERARLSELAQTNQELETLRASLEIRVKERTHELEQRSVELSQSQKRTQSLLAQLDEASRLTRLAHYELKPDAQTIVFSDLFYELLHTTAEKEGGYEFPIAQAFQRFIHPDDASRLFEDLKSIGTVQMEGDLEYRLLDALGAVRTFSFRFGVETDSEGRSAGVKGAVQDITDRKKAEEELMLSQERYALSLEGSSDGLWDWDVRTNQIYYSPRWKGIAGYEDHELENAFSTFEDHLHPEDRDRVLKAVDEYLERRIPAYDVEFRFRHKDGSYRWVRDRGKALRDESGQPYRMSGAHSDITPLKESEIVLAKRATELETVTQVATSMATIQDPQEMLQYVSDLIKERFNFYHAHIYLLDEVDGLLELAAGAGEAGQTMVASQHSIPLAREQSLVARAARTHQGVVVNDVTQAPDFLPNPLLPETQSELAVPLLIGTRVLGVLDVQAAQKEAFTEEDVRIQTILAAQIAITLQNSRSSKQSAQTLQELDTLTRRLTREGWQSYLGETERERLGFVFENEKLTLLQGNGIGLDAEKSCVQPVILHGETIGKLIATGIEMDGQELQVILAAVSQGLSAHLENLRLTEEAERRVAELDVVNEIGQVLTTEVDLQKIIVTVVKSLSRAFNANVAYIALYDSARQMIEIPYMLDRGQEIFDEPSFSFGEGVNSTLIQTRQPIFVNQNTERRMIELGALPTGNSNILSKSFIGIPMTIGAQVLGVLSIQDTEREGRFTQSDLDLLTTIAANVAVAIQNARLFAQAQKRAEREALVNLIGQKIQSTTSVQGALQTAIQELGLALKSRRTTVALDSKADKKYEPEV